MATAIMIQGTSSNVGKSLIAAGLCRLLAQAGYAVAPFKAQNMALNSAPALGGEIGRAQALQAVAAGVEPSVLMNPVLLKPTDKKRAQLIVNGKASGYVSARQYYQQKEELKKVIKKAYQKLAKEHQVIVIEGAGSPAEINLKSYDIANMWMAKLAQANVFLVGDIERGGVFAALWGTFALLSKKEQQYLKGFIINKFRGDVGLLASGFTKLFKLTGRPTVGVIPYYELQLDAEDSLALTTKTNTKSGKIKIGVVKLPHISNFTDFQPFVQHQEVALTYLEKPEQLNGHHVCFIPGTKNSIADLRWLKKLKFDLKLKEFAAHGGLLIGICGGYQILGQQISDPDGAEVAKGTIEAGLGLLPVKTGLTLKKVVRNIEAKANLPTLFAAAPIKAYEIHTGVTPVLKGVFCLADGLQDGTVNKEGNVIGTYLHGLFANEPLRKQFLTYVAQKAGLKVKVSKTKSLAQRLDEWANVLREN
jgi:adenosylcobyric acid synthase